MCALQQNDYKQQELHIKRPQTDRMVTENVNLMTIKMQEIKTTE